LVRQRGPDDGDKDGNKNADGHASRSRNTNKNLDENFDADHKSLLKLIIGELFSPIYTICFKKYYIKMEEVVCFKIGLLEIVDCRRQGVKLLKIGT
jgi:hypothetical protein